MGEHVSSLAVLGFLMILVVMVAMAAVLYRVVFYYSPQADKIGELKFENKMLKAILDDIHPEWRNDL